MDQLSIVSEVVYTTILFVFLITIGFFPVLPSQLPSDSAWDYLLPLIILLLPLIVWQRLTEPPAHLVGYLVLVRGWIVVLALLMWITSSVPIQLLIAVWSAPVFVLAALGLAVYRRLTRGDERPEWRDEVAVRRREPAFVDMDEVDIGIGGIAPWRHWVR